MKRKPVKRDVWRTVEPKAPNTDNAAEIAAKAEVAMMGMCVPVGAQSEVQPMFEYIARTLNVDISANSELKDVLNNRIKRYTPTNEVAYVVANTLTTGERVVAFLLRSNATGEDKYPDPFTTDYGTGYPCAFTYNVNLDADEVCSEFGDAFFERVGEFYKRVS